MDIKNHCFRGFQTSQLPVSYFDQRNAWMTASVSKVHPMARHWRSEILIGLKNLQRNANLALT